MSLTRKSLALLLALALVFVMFVACGKAADKGADAAGGDEAEQIIIGYIGALTGESAAYGEVALNVLKLLVEDTNNEGGLLGKEVVLKTYDNRGDPVETTNAARKAIQSDKVVCFIGPDASSGAIALDEVCKEYKIPHITNVGTNYKVTQNEEDGSVRPYSFRACLSDPQLGDVIAGYAIDEMNATKAAILYDVALEYSVGVMENFVESFEEKGGTVVITEAFKTGDNDFRAQLSKMKDVGGFDVFLVPCTYKEIALITSQARALGIEATFLGGDAWMNNDLFSLAEESVQGSMFPNAMDMDDPALDEFKARFREAYGTEVDQVGTDGYMAYDSYMIVKNAIEKSGTGLPEDIRDQMAKTTDVQGLSTKITIDPETHNPLRNAAIYTIEGTDFVKVTDYKLN